MNQEEQNYLNLLKEIIDIGDKQMDRTGVGTLSIFGGKLKFSLENNTLPLITTKKMFFRGIVEELLFFIRGETNTKLLEEKGVNIWKGNTSREFLDSRGLTNLPEGHMGKGYGFQWRNFNGDYLVNNGVDQLKNAINTIKNNPYDRRIIISAWNPFQLNEAALPPCHTSVQFYVNSKKELSSQFTMRSSDAYLGVVYNFCSYALLTHIIAKVCNLKPKEVIFIGGNIHVYMNHLEQVKEQISRVPYNFPKISINKELNSLEDIESLKFEDFKLENYKYYPAIKANMAI